MKNNFVLIVLMLSLFFAKNAEAQQNNATFIYRNDNAFNVFSCSDIDSITYEGERNNATQIIWINEEQNRIPVSVIDSVSFSFPQNVLLPIAEEDLNGWEIGYRLGDEYVVAYHEDSDNTLIMMKNKYGADAGEGLIICFNEESEIIKAGLLGKVYDVKNEGNNIILYRISEDGFIEKQIIPTTTNVHTKIVPTRAISVDDITQLIKIGINFVGNVAQGGAVATDVANWKWNWPTVSETMEDTGWLFIGLGTKGIPGIVITIGKAIYDQYRESQYEQNRSFLYGKCTISIDEIRPDNEKSLTYVYATIRDANTLPAYVFEDMYDRSSNEETRNLVSCGIIVRKHNDYVTTHLKDYESQTTQINGDVSYGAEANLLFTIPYLDLTNSISNFYFRPYLTSTRPRNNNDDVAEGYIKYGDTVPYNAFNGEIDEFKQYSAEYSTDTNGYGFVQFLTKVHATILSLDNLEEWGVYILEEDGTYRLEASEFRAAKLDDWITLNFNINKNDFDEINSDNFFASKKIKMGVYKKIKNPTGNYDYLSYLYSEPQEYELIYDVKPSLNFINVQVESPEAEKKYDEYGNYKYTLYYADILIDYKVEGAFWMDYVQSYVYGGEWNDGEGPVEIVNDGDYSNYTGMSYSEKVDMDFVYGYNIYLNNGTSIKSNNTIVFGGSHTQPTAGVGGNPSNSRGTRLAKKRKANNMKKQIFEPILGPR